MTFDLPLLLWLQEVCGPQSYPFWSVVSDLGAAPCVAFTVGVALWVRSTHFGLRVMLAAVVTILLVDLLKVASFQPRPFYVWEQVHAYSLRDGLGMPSGHAAVAACVWGTIALAFRSRLLQLLAILVVLLVGLSRIYLGVHSPTQVLLGWLFGGLVLVCLCRYREPVHAAFATWRFPRQVALALVVSLGLMGSKWLLTAPFPQKQSVPAAWSARYASEAKAAGEAEEARAMSLFRRVHVDHLGAFLGVFVVLIYVARGGGAARFSSTHAGLNLAIGGVFVTGVVLLVRALADSQVVLGLVALPIPFGLAIGVPAVGGWCARRLAGGDEEA